jgi:head-tail adaptor
MIGMRSASIGERPHLVTLTNPGVGSVPDGDGGYTPAAPQPLDPPTAWAQIVAATQQDLEQIAAGTVLATATHLLTMPFHLQVTTLTSVTWTDAAGRAHRANVTGVIDGDQRAREVVVGLVEVIE